MKGISMKRYLENTIKNMRDIGGHVTEDKKVKYGKLIRSNLPITITKDDIDFLKQMGIKTIIDLRSKDETNKVVSAFENNPFFDVFHYEISGGEKIPDSPENVPISYMQMLEQKESIYHIFKKLAEEENGIIYFCNAGKDRTGVVTALILMALGVKKEDIISDYVLSAKYLKDMLDTFASHYDKENIREIITPKEEYMRKFLQYFNKKYNNINQYLYKIGITDNEIHVIKEKYVI